MFEQNNLIALELKTVCTGFIETTCSRQNNGREYTIYKIDPKIEIKTGSQSQ